MESHERPDKQRESHGGTVLQSQGKEKHERFLDFLRAAPSKELGVAAPHAFLKRVAALRALRAKCVAWAKHPTNAAMLVWLAFVAAGVAFVFLLMTGALDSAVPDAGRRKRWTEIANQVLNALFTIMCLYQHPRLCHHLVLLARWRAADAVELRGVYCRNAAAAPRHERVHVAVVLVLLHATCLAQYAYCALFWLFSSDTRPDWAVDLCMALGLAAPVAAALYMVYGPLGRKITASAGDEAMATGAALKVESGGGGGRCGAAVTAPEWAGGLLDLADDPTAAALSLACTFCVFGWNMERLGLGNMYVHVFTFALLCATPVLVFAVAALNIHDATVGYLVGAAGALLSVLGLAYGGFWRAQMRRRFGLPAARSVCGGRPAAADYLKWLLCAPCALAQEVRTGNLYDVEEGRLYLRGSGEDVATEEEPGMMAPLEREGCVAPLTAGSKGSARDGVECVVAVDAPPLQMMGEERWR